MNITDRYFADRVLKWVLSTSAQRRDEIASGMASDHADYRYRVGYIECLRDLSDVMQATEQEMNAPPQRQESPA